VIDLEPRPKYRGVSHRIAFHCAIVAGAILVWAARDAQTRFPCIVYATFLSAMFGVSATLHRADWSPRTYSWLRRADHSTIFVCIAGTYTPFALLGLGGTSGTKLCLLAWTVCSIGVLRAMLWPHAPRAITSTCYVAAGWFSVAFIPELRAALDPVTFALIFGGGAIFTIGAVIYLLKWPDPIPAVFGYHEVFHIVIILGCTTHFAAVVRLATR
jgi:hemolysin III